MDQTHIRLCVWMKREGGGLVISLRSRAITLKTDTNRLDYILLYLVISVAIAI